MQYFWIFEFCNLSLFYQPLVQMSSKKLTEVAGFQFELETAKKCRVKFTETTLMRKVRMILWIKVPRYLVALGHDASVESAAKCWQKRNVCAVKNGISLIF